MAAVDTTLGNHGVGDAVITKKHVRVKIKAKESMIAFDHGGFTKWTHPSVDKGSNRARAANNEINRLASTLLCCGFLDAGVLMVMEVGEIRFTEDARDFHFGVIDWVIGIHADDDFFLLLSPVTDLLDKIVHFPNLPAKLTPYKTSRSFLRLQINPQRTPW